MCGYGGLPLALILEELVEIDRPEDEEEQPPETAEHHKQHKRERLT